jgi:ankyrin repeat protein
LTFEQDVDRVDEEELTAAHWATLFGFPAILEALIVRGADIQCRDHDFKTLMNYAMWNWVFNQEICLEFVYLLLQNGFDVNTADTDENTPLHLAVLKSSARIIVILKRYNANPLLRNNNGYTPIDIARNMGNHHLVSLLKSAPLSGG